ncbi:MAG: NrsF family protein [Sphingosinicella sp.]|uniref:NrsF family protein n=1 Tax=Sphingosinicella sp. TaxID=1917971 RepID=UPI004037F31F
MSRPTTDELIDSLAAGVPPVKPLVPPLRRGLAALAVLAIAGTALVLAFGDADGLLARYAGRETRLALELGAMLLTAALALLGAFAVSIPGRSRRWLPAPVPALLAWVGLSGAGCYEHFVATGSAGALPGESADCFRFLLVGSLIVGLPILWLLARARPVEPLPVAALGSLGAAAATAFLLQFFHPFQMTLADLGVHLFAVVLIVLAASLTRRLTLKPA